MDLTGKEMLQIYFALIDSEIAVEIGILKKIEEYLNCAVDFYQQTND